MSKKNSKMRSRYKVLPLPSLFSYPEDMWGCERKDFLQEKKRIPAVFHRDGLYLERKTGLTWIEFQGEAYLYGDKEWFEYNLDHSVGNNRLHPIAYEAIQTILSFRLGDKRLWKLYLVENQMRALRSIHVNTTLSMRRWLVEID